MWLARQFSRNTVRLSLFYQTEGELLPMTHDQIFTNVPEGSLREPDLVAQVETLRSVRR
jgi:hypothetical protein